MPIGYSEDEEFDKLPPPKPPTKNIRNYDRTMWAVHWVESGGFPRHSEFDGLLRDNEAEAREFLDYLRHRGNHTGVLMRGHVVWRPVVEESPYPHNVKCACGDLITRGMPYVDVEADGVLWHGDPRGGGHRADDAV